VKQALLTFEDEQKHEAVQALKQTTELCKADHHKSRKSRRKHSTDVLYCWQLLRFACIYISQTDLYTSMSWANQWWWLCESCNFNVGFIIVW